MTKVVVDTNVLISALIGKGYPKLILKELFFNETFIICTSEDCLKEFERVLYYKHLIKYPQLIDEGNTLLAEIRTSGLIYKPIKSILILRDISDNKFLELAVEGKADYLITGNHLHFNFDKFENTKIVSPKKFWDLYQENNL